MRILLTSNYKVGSETGSAFVTDTLAFSLAKKHSVCYVCLGDKFEIKNESKNLIIIKMPSAEVNGIAIPLLTPGSVLDAQKEMDRFSPDIVHTQNSVIISNLAQIWANQKSIPVVTTFHHAPTRAISYLLPRLSNNFITKAVERFYTQTTLATFLKNTNGIVALNKDQEKEVRRVNKTIRISVINNGLDLSDFKRIKRKKDLGETINFVFLGSYIERKNQELLVKTFKLLPENYRLKCYGNIKSGMNYYNMLKKIKPKNVELFDYSNKITKILKESDFFVSASLKEIQSLAVIQAMAAGLPVIGIENKTISELINKSNGLKLDKTSSPKKFAGSIKQFVESCDYSKISQKVRNDSDMFDIKKVIVKIEGFYDEVLRNHTPKRV